MYGPLKLTMTRGGEYILDPKKVSKENYGSVLLTDPQISQEPHPPKRERIMVLRDTLTKFEQDSDKGSFHATALENLKRWRAASQASGPHPGFVIHLRPGDWGLSLIHI